MSSRRGTSLRPAPRIPGWLLLLYPARFRASYFAEMQEVFSERYADEARRSGRCGVARLWTRTILNILLTAAMERSVSLRRKILGEEKNHWLGERDPNTWPAGRPGKKGDGLMQTFSQDLRYGARMLRRNPGFTAVAVLTLALGIGANTAIFSVIYGVLLSPVPYPDSEELVVVWARHTKGNWTRGGISLQNYEDWRVRNRAFEHIGVYNVRGGNLSGGETPRNVDYALVSPSYFRVFGVQPSLGRWFTEEENFPGQDSVVIVSDSLWKSVFGSAPDIVGKKLRLVDRTLEIIGVMPAEFDYPDPGVQAWKPFGMNPDDGGPRSAHWAYVVGRRNSSVSLEQAQAEMDTIAAALEQEYPDSNQNVGTLVEPLRDAGVVKVRSALLILWFAVSLVLLIACVNVANLLLARAAARAKEIAIRVAMGAARARLVRQLLTESLLLMLLGGAGGVVLALWALPVVVAMSSESLPRVGEIALNGEVLAFALALSVLTGVVFGLVPAFRAAAGNVLDALKDGGRKSSGQVSQRLRGVLVVSEVALALVLFTGAGLLLRSFSLLSQEDVGFSPDHLLTFRLEPSMQASSAGKSREQFFAEFTRERGQIKAFFDRLEERIEAVPGVRSLAAVNRMPLSGNMWGVSVAVEGRPISSVEEKLFANVRVVTDSYFSTLGVPLLQGRMLTERDRADAPLAVVINQAMAEQYWPGEDPMGQRYTYEYPPEEANFWFTIVGVVGNVRHNSTSIPPSPVAYTPLSQALFGFFGNWGMDVIVRAEGNPLDLAGVVRSELQALDPNLPAFRMQSMEQAMERDLASFRFNTFLFAFFALFALLLASVGVYGVISYFVSHQTHDIGVRMALGAQRSSILRLVLWQGAKYALLGIGLGLAVAVALSGYLGGLVYRVAVTDPITIATVSLLMFAVALLACVIPARRATKVDPMVALRYE